jgi:hypothetical protein
VTGRTLEEIADIDVVESERIGQLRKNLLALFERIMRKEKA